MTDYIKQIFRDNGFINGIYVPWFDKDWFGFDIGKSVYDNYKKCFFDEKYIRSVFTNCKAIGFDMAKIWLNESFEGMLFDENGSVIGVEPTFSENLKKILSIIKSLDFKLALCVNAHQEMYFPYNKTLYDKYMRFAYIPEETEKYIVNWLKPVLKIASESGCVPMIDLYAEPEADGGGWKVSRGFSWGTMVKFINRIASAVKEVDPMFATTVSSGAGCATLSEGKYNGVNVDYLGADLYTDDGHFDTPRSMLLSKPFMLGEYGLSNYKTATCEDQIRIVDAYIKNCLDNDVVAAFYWCYGWKCKKADEMHIIDFEGEFKPVVSYYHFTGLDRKNGSEGKNIPDKPVFLALTSPERLRWLGTRGAEYYEIVRTDGNRKKTVARIENPEKEAKYPTVLRYCDKEGDNDSRYTVISVMPDGEKTVSDTAGIIKG